MNPASKEAGFSCAEPVGQLAAKVLLTADGRELIAKRNGEITLVARRGRKDAPARGDPENKNRIWRPTVSGEESRVGDHSRLYRFGMDEQRND